MDAERALASGPIHRFADWPNDDVPAVAAGVYSVWGSDARLLYVGISGLDRSAQQLAKERTGAVRRGLWTRLNSHASGRRSGDQFNVYVADRLVLPRLTTEQIGSIASGSLRFDHLVRDWIRSNLGYRFVVTEDGDEASRLEARCRAGALGAKPMINPAGGAR